ncbi:RNA polymerase II C-terminal domain phosphatase-like protein 1 [Striga asiatica]|uniref:protein-serine/threonine phosphatase n=1 Tax=Striga asiatica TaxID=4170 RepID=A0A5A7QXZ8_STRAF|nr:RNA polymerase II C-terminal domain phosphatase-like protein 1 [Striga asiatica]
MEINLIPVPVASSGSEGLYFWGLSMPKGAYGVFQSIFLPARLGLILDLDVTLLCARSASLLQKDLKQLKNEKKITGYGLDVSIGRCEEDLCLLRQFIESNSITNHSGEVMDTNTSMIVRVRPAWTLLRDFIRESEDKMRFKVVFCTAVEREYALLRWSSARPEREYALLMWRLLDPES